MLHHEAGVEACCLDLLHLLLPHLKNVHVNAVTHMGQGVLISARTRDNDSACRTCTTPSRRVHSRYRRLLTDVTCGNMPVTIDLQTRRFFCVNQSCSTGTFAEQVPGLAKRHARRTVALDVLLENLALALAGRAGARLAARLGITVSRSLLIRLLRALPDPAIGQVRVLGVDDFAKRKGHSYATILIDMDTGHPIDVLDDRLADTLAEWLREHPGVEVVCRDRASAYADGAKKGAPEAIQVADRFHLWQNLCRAVEKTIVAHRADLREPAPEPTATGTLSIVPESPQPQPESRTTTRTRERHADIHDLLAQGKTHTEICKLLGLSDKTVRKFRHAATADQATAGARLRSSGIDWHAAYLHQRWQEGCTDAARLHTEIQARGYRGSTRSVRRFVQPLRAGLTMPQLPPPPPTVREVTRWITARPDHVTEDEQLALKQITTRSPHLQALAGHVTAFAEMMTGRHGERLDGWLAAVEADELPYLHSLAKGLRQDHAAVFNGLTLEHSSGAVEGNVCRVKALKRQMYGRARLDLLRKRILLSR